MKGRLVIGALGVVLMIVGAGGLLLGGSSTSPLAVGPWLVGVLVAHDLFLAPAAGVIGWLLSRALPGRARRPVQVGLIIAAIISLVALPAVLGFGGQGNPTVLPLDYGRNLLVLLIAIALATLAAVLIGEITHAVRERGPRTPALRRTRPPAG